VGEQFLFYPQPRNILWDALGKQNHKGKFENIEREQRREDYRFDRNYLAFCQTYHNAGDVLHGPFNLLCSQTFELGWFFHNFITVNDTKINVSFEQNFNYK
jgi:hypothetical protein